MKRSDGRTYTFAPTSLDVRPPLLSGGQPEVLTYACSECGAMVKDTGLHVEWHEKIRNLQMWMDQQRGRV